MNWYGKLSEIEGSGVTESQNYVYVRIPGGGAYFGFSISPVATKSLFAATAQLLQQSLVHRRCSVNTN